MNAKKTPFYNHQSGMVAITVTMILMIVISLIVIGFSTTVRREQRQQLDSQLASQAFYAAESGVNMAEKKLRDDSNFPNKSTCSAGSDFNYNISDGVAVTCLLIDASPTSTEFGDLQPMHSQASIIDTGGNSWDNISIKWRGTSVNVTGCNVSGFPAVSAWPASCSPPILRIDLVNLGDDPVNSINPANYNPFTAFLYPKRTAGETVISYTDGTSSNRGSLRNVHCNNGGVCMLKINNIPSGVLPNKFGIRIMGLYRTAKSVTIQALSGTTPQPLIGSQAVIDSTARAQDVLKRVQVRVSLFKANGRDGNIPDFAITASDGICKRMAVAITGAQVDYPSGYNATTNPECKLD